MYKTGLGVSLASSQRQLRVESERLAQQRRITEAEVAAKKSSEDTSALREKALVWAPRIIGGLALLIAAVLVMKKRKGA